MFGFGTRLTHGAKTNPSARPFRLVKTGLALWVCFFIPAYARQSGADLRVETTLVVIPVTVTDGSNRFVLGLEKRNFALSEDGVRQEISQFATEDAPLSLGLLVDTSGSMGSKIQVSRQAVAEALKALTPNDEAFLVEFSDRPELKSPFTSDFASLEASLSTAEAGGLTALLDAVQMGLDQMKHAAHPRKALLIISDGGDNNSRHTREQIQLLVRQADVQVYAVGVFPSFAILQLSAAEATGPALLAELAEQTGGRLYAARGFGMLPGIARRIGIELRNQYVLAYRPRNEARDGRFRKIEVKVTPPDGIGPVKARWRPGYFARKAQ